MKIDGNHTTGYFYKNGKVHLYDGLQNEGKAQELDVNRLSALPKDDFKFISHLVYIQSDNFAKGMTNSIGNCAYSLQPQLKNELACHCSIHSTKHHQNLLKPKGRLLMILLQRSPHHYSPK